MSLMPRTRQEDRDNVTSRGGPALTIRLTPAEAKALQALVDQQRAAAEQIGILASAVSSASVLRLLLRREAQAKGVWPSEATPPATPPAAAAPVPKAAPAPKGDVFARFCRAIDAKTVTTGELAAELGLGAQAIRNWRTRGGIPPGQAAAVDAALRKRGA